MKVVVTSDEETLNFVNVSETTLDEVTELEKRHNILNASMKALIERIEELEAFRHVTEERLKRANIV